VILGVALATLVGCAAPDNGAADRAAPSDRPAPTASGPLGAGKILTVPQAIKAGDQPVKVRGYILVGADGVTRLCTGLAGSYPPQCGGPSLVVKGLKLDAIPARESAQGIVWSGETTVRGTLSRGVLTVS
jgi:hypothetical protein